jgi:putative sugar O-methyltransferase
VLLDNRRLNNPTTRRIPGFFYSLMALDYVLSDVVLPRVFKSNMIYGLGPGDVEELAYDVAAEEGRRNLARPLSELKISLEGDPPRVFYRDGQPMTISLLYYYMRYAYVSRFVDFDGVRHIAELGSGSGKQIEVLAKLHPNICFFLFDIPPELYVCEQYLKAALGDRVVSFRNCREMTSAPPVLPGKVYLFGNWQFSLLSQCEPDLFWNAASFQEMEPHVVENYLSVVGGAVPALFIQAVMDGMHQAKRKGQHGVLEKTTFEHFRRFLPAFTLADMRKSRTPLRPLRDHSDSFWMRKEPIAGRSAPFLRSPAPSNGVQR